jgi:sec-independent protein translocase protein TatA
MFNLGPWEIAAVLIVALLIFGPRKLPEIGKAIGTAINEFRASLSGVSPKHDEPEHKKLEDKKINDEEKPAG